MWGGNAIEGYLDNERELRAHWKRLHPPAMLIMSDAGSTRLAREVKQDNPQTEVIFRPYHPQDHAWQAFRSAEEIWEDHRRYAVYATGATVNTQLRVRSETNVDVMAFNYAINQPIQVYLYGTSWTLLGATSANVPNATWQLIEMHIRFHPTAGIIEIRQDGVMTFFYRGGTSLQGVPCRLIQWENAANSFAYVDDIAINDTSGTEDNSWPGDGYTVLVPIVAQGDAADWKGSDGDKTDNYLLVDDLPSDAETSYVFAGAPGAKDLYVPGAFALTADAIQRVWVAGHVRKLFTFSQGVEFGVKQDGVEAWSAAQILPTASYAVLRSKFWTTNPITSAAWTEDDLNELQVGIRIP